MAAINSILDTVHALINHLNVVQVAYRTFYQFNDHAGLCYLTVLVGHGQIPNLEQLKDLIFRLS
jgi:hypothetical protein